MRVAVLTLAVFGVACGEPPPAAPATPAAAMSCPAQPAEDCARCYANVGTCCYMDPRIGGAAPDLVANCERSPACRSCCNECATMPCDQLRARMRCPNL